MNGIETKSPQNPQKEKNKSLGFLFLLGAVGLAFAYVNNDSSQTTISETLKRDEIHQQNVNKHLMYMNDRVEYQKKKVELENDLALQNSLKTKGQSASHQKDDHRLDLSYEDPSIDMAKELGRGDKKEEIWTAEDAVQKDLYAAQQEAQYNQAYKEEYARQFVENARRGGYKVILSEDLSRVISVTPIRNPSKESFDVFGSGTSPVR